MSKNVTANSTDISAPLYGIFLQIEKYLLAKLKAASCPSQNRDFVNTNRRSNLILHWSTRSVSSLSPRTATPLGLLSDLPSVMTAQGLQVETQEIITTY